MPSSFRQARLSFLFVIALVSLSSLLPKPVVAGCGGPTPPMPMVWAKTGPSAGEVTLTWQSAPHANRYAVTYGTGGSYQYGAENIGGVGSTSYTVKSLKPGTSYSFQIAAANGCASSPFSAPVSAVSGGGSLASADMMVVAPTTTAATQSTVMPHTAGPVGKQGLWAKSGPKVGEITLYWKDADSANNYHLMYGTEHGKFQYGALSIGNVKWFTVRHLTPGKVYHMALVPTLNGRALYTTDQVMVGAMAPVPVVQNTQAAVPDAAISEIPSNNVVDPVTGEGDTSMMDPAQYPVEPAETEVWQDEAEEQAALYMQEPATTEVWEGEAADPMNGSPVLGAQETAHTIAAQATTEVWETETASDMPPIGGVDESFPM